MQFTLTITMDNAAFEDDGELARVVRQVAEKVIGVAPFDSGPVRDINGNLVGSWEVTS